MDNEQLKNVFMEIEARLGKLEHTMDVMLSSLKSSSDEYEYNDGLDKFHEAYGEQLDPVMAKMKILYGDDYDGYKDLYDLSREHSGEEGFDEASYIAEQIDEINKKLSALMDASSVKEEPVVEEETATSEEDDVPSEEELMAALRAAE